MCVWLMPADEWQTQERREHEETWNKIPQNKSFCGLLKITEVINSYIIKECQVGEMKQKCQ